MGDDVVACNADGTLGDKKETCPGLCRMGACADSCAIEDVELVYVVDSSRNLVSFDPRKLPDDPFHVVGRLDCDPTDSPFSMAVDRKGIAWVLYGNGKLYRVSIVDATCTGPVETAGTLQTYGMGFASDGTGKDASETLFVAGNDDARELGRLAFSHRPPLWMNVGRIAANQTRNPELTGTGDGRLFAYFPEEGAGFIQELDKKTAQPVGRKLRLQGRGGEVEAWAFAHWGGVFYVFATVDGNSAVHAVNRKTGAYKLVREKLPYRVVGAGVSTCAPLLERAP